MRVADLHTGTARIRDALKTLRVRWEEARQSWDDSVSQEFEEKYLVEMEQEVQKSLERLIRLTQVITTAETECSPDYE